jgi:hypothetical protein
VIVERNHVNQKSPIFLAPQPWGVFVIIDSAKYIDWKAGVHTLLLVAAVMSQYFKVNVTGYGPRQYNKFLLQRRYPALAAGYLHPEAVTIRQHEYNVFKQREYLIRKQFASYVSSYKKEFHRRQKNPALPVSALCRYSSLQYFHQELGLNN